MPAAALFRGPAHVCDAVNDEWEAISGCRLMVGLPIREVQVDPIYRPYHDLMDEVYRTGRPVQTRLITPFSHVCGWRSLIRRGSSAASASRSPTQNGIPSAVQTSWLAP